MTAFAYAHHALRLADFRTLKCINLWQIGRQINSKKWTLILQS